MFTIFFTMADTGQPRFQYIGVYYIEHGKSDNQKEKGDKCKTDEKDETINEKTPDSSKIEVSKETSQEEVSLNS